MSRKVNRIHRNGSRFKSSDSIFTVADSGFKSRLELGFGKPQAESRADAKFYLTSVMQNEQIGWVDFVCEGLGVALILDSQTTNEC